MADETEKWPVITSQPFFAGLGVFLKILQNSQKNTCARVSFLMKLQAWGLQLY